MSNYTLSLPCFFSLHITFTYDMNYCSDHYLKAGAEHSSAHESFDDDDEIENGQQSESQPQPTSDYVATGDDMKVDHHQQAGPPTSSSLELPEVKPGTVRTLV